MMSYTHMHIGDHAQYQQEREVAGWGLVRLGFASSVQQEIMAACLVAIFLVLLFNSTLKYVCDNILSKK